MEKVKPWLGEPQNTIAVLQKYGFVFQKKYGQNFLIDPHVLDKIVAAAGIGPDDFVVEIGPGIGTLTQYLAYAARSVCAVEIDKNLIPILEDTLSDYDNVEVINNDVLKVDLAALAKEKNTAAKTQRANMSFFAGRAVTEGLPEEDAQALEAAKGTVITAKELQPEQVDTLAEVLSGVCARLQLQQGELAQQQTAAQNDRDECMKRIEAAQPLMKRFEELESAEKALQECAAQADEIEKKRGLIGKIRDAWAIEPKYQRMKDAQKALTDAQRELAAKQQELPKLKQTAADAAALHQQMEKTKDAATTQCAEVETKVEKALETFVALEKAEKALRQAQDNRGSGRPTVVIAVTTKGKGVSFMENDILWHYRTPQGEEYDAALAELEAQRP